MALQFLFLSIGLAVLVFGAQRLIAGASSLALRLGMSPLLIGLTVVAFGTSAPEMAVSVKAALSGEAALSVANIIGSNLFNVLFILGLCALAAPLVVARGLIWRDVPAMVLFSLLLFLFSRDQLLSRWEAGFLFLVFIAYTVHLIRDARKEKNQELNDDGVERPDDLPEMPLWRSLFLIGVGLALLVLGSRWMVDAAIAIASALGVDQVIIGLTIVAAGTSLPEVAASLIATVKGERDIAVGNVVGSNIFNILAVGGLSGLVAPEGLPVAPGLVFFDLPFMCATAVACMPIFFTGHTIARWEGGLFFAYYIFYTVYLIMTATQHALVSHFETAMLWFVIPLTVITLMVVTYRAIRAGGLMRPQGGMR